MPLKWTQKNGQKWQRLSFVSFSTIKKIKRNELLTKYTINRVIKDTLKDTVLRSQTERSTHCMLLTGPVQKSLHVQTGMLTAEIQ